MHKASFSSRGRNKSEVAYYTLVFNFGTLKRHKWNLCVLVFSALNFGREDRFLKPVLYLRLCCFPREGTDVYSTLILFNHVKNKMGTGNHNAGGGGWGNFAVAKHTVHSERMPIHWVDGNWRCWGTRLHA